MLPISDAWPTRRTSVEPYSIAARMFSHAIEFVGSAVGKNKLSILIYHQVFAEPDPMRPTQPTRETFEWHMRLVRQHYKPMSLAEGVERLQDGTLPGNAVCVTFDDGYINNLTVAEPILRKYGIPATVYIATGFCTGRNMWNDQLIQLFADTSRNSLVLSGEEVPLNGWAERCRLASAWLDKLKYLPMAERQARVDDYYRENHKTQSAPLMMNPDQIRALAKAGVTIGGHTISHPILKTLSEDEQAAEISGCKAELESWLDRPVEHFAYPNGVFGKDLDETTVKLVQDAGFNTAVVTDWGVCTRSTSPWRLSRFTPWDRSSIRFQLRLLKNTLSG